jgi:hypothetical protein
MVTTLPPLRVITRVRCPRSTRNQCALRRRSKPGGDRQRAELVTVQPGGVRLVVQARSADVRGRGMAEEFFLNGVPVEPSDGAEPPRDGGPGVAAGFEVARESTRCPRGGPGISAAGAAGTSLRTGAGQARTLPGRGQRTGSWRSSGTSRVWLRPGGWASRGPSKWKPTVRRPRRSRQVTLQAHPEVPNNHILPAEYLLIRLDWPSVPKCPDRSVRCEFGGKPGRVGCRRPADEARRRGGRERRPPRRLIILSASRPEAAIW